VIRSGTNYINPSLHSW